MALTGSPWKTPLWLRIVLFTSLALNLLVAGVVAGVLLTGGPERRADHDRRDFGSIYTRALDPEDRRSLRREFLSALPERGRDGAGIVAGLQPALSALRATPFDPDAFARAMANQSDRRAERDRLGREILAARIAAMSETERAAYADRVAQGLADLDRRLRR